MRQMKQMIKDSQRRLVVITDPHIKQDDGYSVYDNAMKLHDTWENGSYLSLYVRERIGEVLYGECWPGVSAWIDFINENARNYWSSLYSFESFNDTDDLFHIWLDMNEPSVFDSTEGTLPKDALHYTALEEPVQHKDVHNAYGRFMAQATYDGLISR